MGRIDKLLHPVKKAAQHEKGDAMCLVEDRSEPANIKPLKGVLASQSRYRDECPDYSSEFCEEKNGVQDTTTSNKIPEKTRRKVRICPQSENTIFPFEASSSISCNSVKFGSYRIQQEGINDVFANRSGGGTPYSSPPASVCDVYKPILDLTDRNPPCRWLKSGLEYRGFCPFASYCAGMKTPVPKIPYSALTPEEFFDQFVVKRRPCVLTTSGLGHRLSPDAGVTEFSRALTLWRNDSYLHAAAGSCIVDVEYRDSSVSGKFGQGCRKRMRFSKVIEHISQGKQSLYLTTQKIPEGPTGPTQLAGKFLLHSGLKDDYPREPSLLKTLVPAQYNLWFGSASGSGSSTGLHHDFHDNLYVVIRGTKTFRLFSPRCAELLGTRGAIKRMHPNGLICYSNSIRADGIPECVVHEWRGCQAEKSRLTLHRRLQNLLNEVSVLKKSIKQLEKKINTANPPLKSRRFSIANASALKAIVTVGLFDRLGESSASEALGLLKAELNSRLMSIVLVLQYIRLADGTAADPQEEKDQPVSEAHRAVPGDGETLQESSVQSHHDSTVPEELAASKDDTPASRSSLAFLKASLSDTQRREIERKTQQVKASITQDRSCSNAHYDIKEETCNGGEYAVEILQEESSAEPVLQEALPNLRDLDEEERELDKKLDGFLDQCSVSKKKRLKKKKRLTSDSPEDDVTPAHFCLNNTVARDNGAHGEVEWGKFPEPVTQDLETARQTLLQNYIEVTLEPSDILYLPASWFHEVISSNSSTNTQACSRSYQSTRRRDGSKKKVAPLNALSPNTVTAEDSHHVNSKHDEVTRGNEAPGHMAFNAWFYPPSCHPQVTEVDFREPYLDSFPRRLYQKQLKEEEEFAFSASSLDFLTQDFLDTTDDTGVFFDPVKLQLCGDKLTLAEPSSPAAPQTSFLGVRRGLRRRRGKTLTKFTDDTNSRPSKKTKISSGAHVSIRGRPQGVKSKRKKAIEIKKIVQPAA